jgi:flavin reductase (DIM6/NTAB) family NADH-FMN oxidoreductase RutF
LEATPRIELGMEVLQTSALPLGYVALPRSGFYRWRSDSQAEGPKVRLRSQLPSQEFKDVMARLPSGVVVVSARVADGYRGLTASSLVAISAEPPMVMVGLERDATTRTAVVEGRAFNVSVLTRSQEFVAERFAGRAPAVDPAWKEVPHRLGTNGIPLIEGCAAWLECGLVEVHPAGDHDICVGEVHAAIRGAGDPLILWDRAFWTLR